MTRPSWPEGNIEILRADASAGWTLAECALRNKFNSSTAAMHAKKHGIVFVKATPKPPSGGKPEATRVMNPEFLAHEQVAAAKQLRIEIAAAKSETLHAAPYRGGWPDDV